ncbi:hypothetical protein ACN68_15295 [Escherichia coli]|nr:hypothetical protein ACN68_15295 [Escherichia coli]
MSWQPPFDLNHMGTGSDKSDALGVPYYNQHAQHHLQLRLFSFPEYGKQSNQCDSDRSPCRQLVSGQPHQIHFRQ